MTFQAIHVCKQKEQFQVQHIVQFQGHQYKLEISKKIHALRQILMNLSVPEKEKRKRRSKSQNNTLVYL